MRLSVWIRIFISLGIFLCTSAIGLWVGSLLIPDAHTEAQKIKWATFGFPPEKVEKIVGEHLCENAYGIIVETAVGQRYISCPSGWQTWDTPSISPMILNECQADPPTQYSPGFSSLPQPVKACAFKYMSEWTIVEYVYTILDDGSVWEWDFTFGIGNVIASYLKGLFWGFIAGIIISGFVWWWGSQKKSPRTT